jgi:hypothetical protein
MTNAQAGGNELFAMTELEEKLRAPGGSRVRQILLERFAFLNKALEIRMKPGLPPEDYSRAEALRNAIAAAQNIMINFPS